MVPAGGESRRLRTERDSPRKDATGAPVTAPGCRRGPQPQRLCREVGANWGGIAGIRPSPKQPFIYNGYFGDGRFLLNKKGWML